MAGIALVAVVLAGLAVHVWMPDSAGSDIAGDALYALAAYAAVALIAPHLPAFALGAIALGWCVAVELLQLTPLPGAAAEVLPASMLILGTVFDGRDLIVYAVTAIVATVVDVAIGRALGTRHSSTR